MLLAPAVAGAQAPSSSSASAPSVRPQRDVVVSYAVSGDALSLVPGGVGGAVTLSWDAAGQRVRAEAQGRSQVAVLDLPQGRGQAWDTSLRVILPFRMKPDVMQALTLDGVRLRLQGKDRVAGVACTTYAYDGPQGPGTACLSADGVLLRGSGKVEGKPAALVATAVTYGRVPPERFAPPPGYIAVPAGVAEGMTGFGGGGAAGQVPGGRGGAADLLNRLGGAGAAGQLRSLLGR